MAAVGPQVTIFDGDKVIQEVVQGDFDRDGKVDIALTRATELTFLKNIGDGKYADPRTIRLNANIGKLAKGRLNGDTLPDLASVVTLANGRTLVRSIFFDRTAGMFIVGPRLVLPASLGSVRDVESIDLTGDVRSEIILHTGTSLRLLSMPDRTRIVDRGTIFSAPTSWPARNGTSFQLTVGDVDNNGRADLLVSHFSRSASTEGVGGTFVIKRTTNGVGVIVSEGPAIASPSLLITDFNGDSIKDLAWVSDTSNLMVSYGTGEGAFASPTLAVDFSALGLRFVPISLASYADRNLDGLPELLLHVDRDIGMRGYTQIKRTAYAVNPNSGAAWSFSQIDEPAYSGVYGQYDQPSETDFTRWRYVLGAQNNIGDVLRIDRRSISLTL